MIKKLFPILILLVVTVPSFGSDPTSVGSYSADAYWSGGWVVVYVRWTESNGHQVQTQSYFKQDTNGIGGITTWDITSQSTAATAAHGLTHTTYHMASLQAGPNIPYLCCLFQVKQGAALKQEWTAYISECTTANAGAQFPFVVPSAYDFLLWWYDGRAWGAIHGCQTGSRLNNTNGWSSDWPSTQPGDGGYVPSTQPVDSDGDGIPDDEDPDDDNDGIPDDEEGTSQPTSQGSSSSQPDWSGEPESQPCDWETKDNNDAFSKLDFIDKLKAIREGTSGGKRWDLSFKYFDVNNPTGGQELRKYSWNFSPTDNGDFTGGPYLEIFLYSVRCLLSVLFFVWFIRTIYGTLTRA